MCGGVAVSLAQASVAGEFQSEKMVLELRMNSRGAFGELLHEGRGIIILLSPNELTGGWDL